MINNTIERAKFFQSVHVWPLSSEINYRGWLKNFKTDEEKKIACKILDFFMYFSARMVDHMLINSIDRVGYILSKLITGWKHEYLIKSCYYSFIPGENPNPTDSGHIFTRKLRDVMEVPEQRIIDFEDIPRILESAPAKSIIILVDDFVGSGSQCYTAWNITRNSFNHKTFKEICDIDGHIFVYAPLIVNSEGYDLIQIECSSLHIAPCHILGSEYDLFNQNCLCWNGDNILYNSGCDLILSKSRNIGIPFTNGRDTRDVRGFGEQGLALKFEHGTPDATIPLFYWCHDNWIPLFNKTYIR